MNPLALVISEASATLRSIELRAAPPVPSSARWTPEQSWAWSERTGWLVGCNFTPSTAGNQLEMWQAETFDLATIDRELGWARELGMNSARIFLHDLAWRHDGEQFLDRVEEVLSVAASHDISVMPVLFDGIWDPRPRIGPQRDPRPGIHNSMWLQSPGRDVIADPSRWDALRPYVEAVIGRFGADPRVVVWDLFNEPDSPNLAYLRDEIPHKADLVARLLTRVFDWATELDPDQPITAGVYTHTTHAAERARETARVSMERSDIITFHSYQRRSGLEAAIDRLERLGRPLVCTEWMARPTSPVELIDAFAARDVGAYCWGLVDGRTQTRFPWTSWVRRAPTTRPWFHDLLHSNGTPYDPAEAEHLRRVFGEGRSPGQPTGNSA